MSAIGTRLLVRCWTRGISFMAEMAILCVSRLKFLSGRVTTWWIVAIIASQPVNGLFTFTNMIPDKWVALLRILDCVLWVVIWIRLRTLVISKPCRNLFRFAV